MLIYSTHSFSFPSFMRFYFHSTDASIRIKNICTFNMQAFYVISLRDPYHMCLATKHVNVVLKMYTIIMVPYRRKVWQKKV